MFAESCRGEVEGKSGSFAPLTPLRGAPSCSAQDDTFYVNV